MSTYHCGTQENSSTSMCGEFEEGDVIVSYEEVHSPDGKWFNCLNCAEEIAQKAGGSTKRRSHLEAS